MLKNKLDLSFCIATVIVFFLILTTVVAVSAKSANNYIVITIEEGDSLWDLAMEYKEYHEMSPNKFIKWVEKNNEINKNRIFSGQQLIIPIEQEEFIAFDK